MVLIVSSSRHHRRSGSSNMCSRIALSAGFTVKSYTSVYVGVSLYGHFMNSPLTIYAWPKEKEGERNSLSSASDSACHLFQCAHALE